MPKPRGQVFGVWERQAWSSFGLFLSEGPATRPGRRGEAKKRPRPVAWRPFHVLTPILQELGWGTLRGVLLSRGIPRGCVAQHTVHEEEEDEEEEQEGGRGGRRVMQDAPGGWMGEGDRDEGR